MKNLAISIKITSIRNWKFWVFWYVVSIFLFSFIYFLFSKDFYFSNSRYEQNTRYLKQQIIGRLQYELNSVVNQKNFPDTSYIVKSIYIYFDGFNFDENESKYQLRMTMELLDYDEPLLLELFISIPFDNNYCEKINISLEKYFEYKNVANPPNFKLFKDFDLEKMRNSLRFLFSDGNEILYLPIEHPTCDMMKNYRDSMQGFAYDYAAYYPRMLYFSIITITTTGYGDILPISDEMRLLVSFEIILGIILSGGFIWSLTEGFK
jgi:Ion channel